MQKIIFLILLSPMLFANINNIKKKIYNEIVEVLPKKLCKPETMYMECYSTTQLSCRKMISESGKVCYKKYAHNITKNEALYIERTVGVAIGQCIFTQYHTELQEKDRADVECLLNPKWKKAFFK